MSYIKYCPYCNWEIYDNECTNSSLQCGYKGPGQRREDVVGSKLGDMTGDPQNNGDFDTTSYDE